MRMISKKSGKTNLLIPITIVIGALIISYSVLNRTKPDDIKPSFKSGALRQVDVQDHILGNPEARVKIVEYSDLQCPFCKRYHSSLKQMIDEYGTDGEVAWVYRHFPIEQLHPFAKPLAIATECAGKLGGNELFWELTDEIFESSPKDNRELKRLVVDLHLKSDSFDECFASGEFDDTINQSINDAVAAGAQGTPFTIVIAGDGSQERFSGAVPYADLKTSVETALAK
jgi:protein-disulfide isomerase